MSAGAAAAAAGMPGALPPPMTPQASVLVRFGIPALGLFVVALVALGVLLVSGSRHAARFVLGSVAWLAFTAALGLSGFLADFSGTPPHILLLMAPTLGLPLTLGFSRVGRRLA